MVSMGEKSYTSSNIKKIVSLLYVYQIKILEELHGNVEPLVEKKLVKLKNITLKQ